MFLTRGVSRGGYNSRDGRDRPVTARSYSEKIDDHPANALARV
jgi:hypothetical protein